MSRGKDRNKERLRNQADQEPYDTQDLRPDYERSRVEDEQGSERADVEEGRAEVEKKIDKSRG